jgi:hypothetical protein
MGVMQVEKIIERAVKSLSQHNQQVDRDRWLKEAKAAEEGGHFVTCEVRVPGSTVQMCASHRCRCKPAFYQWHNSDEYHDCTLGTFP